MPLVWALYSHNVGQHLLCRTAKLREGRSDSCSKKLIIRKDETVGQAKKLSLGTHYLTTILVGNVRSDKGRG